MYATVQCSNQTIPPNGWETVVFDGIWVDSGYDADPLFAYDEPYRFTYPESATEPVAVIITAYVKWATGNGGNRELRINGTQNGNPQEFAAADSTTFIGPYNQSCTSVPWLLYPGDYVQLDVKQMSGDPVDIDLTLLGIHSIAEDVEE